ncbi:MAG: hypothetical protein RIB03_00155 [Henriciella sp.]
MRLNKPRIAPLQDHEIGEEQRALLGERFKGQIYNIFRTLSRAESL